MKRMEGDRAAPVRSPAQLSPAQRLVEVDESRYEELLISNRRLERVWNRLLWLRDLDTDEVFFHRLASSPRLSECA